MFRHRLRSAAPTVADLTTAGACGSDDGDGDGAGAGAGGEVAASCEAFAKIDEEYGD